MQSTNVNRSVELAAKRYAETLVAHSGSAFFWAMRRMLPAKRDAMYAIYAFCREVDDIADEPGETSSKREALKGYRRDVERLYRGAEPARATVRALVRPVSEYELAESDLKCVIDGMMTDAEPSVRIPDDTALATYVDRVACSVGRMSCRVFGLDPETGRQLAASLGSALQLTNILRDVREDARRNRIYLPESALRDAGLECPRTDTLADQPAVGIVCQGLSTNAWNQFAAADRIMGACRAQDIRPARMMRAVYGNLLERIVGAGFSPFPAERISLSSFRRACLALRHGLFQVPGIAHVVGAGVAGLSAACELSACGVHVAVHEATGHAGGRCRSFRDDSLGALIDNGSHLMLSGNTSIQRFLALIGAQDRLSGPASARFPFLDLATGERWTVDLGSGRIPGRPFSRDGRVPGARLADYARSLRLLNAHPGSSIEEILSPCGRLHERFWKPVSIAVLNTEPESAAAALMKPVLRETVGRGGVPAGP